MNTVTLHCQAGHDWERPSQRGRRPLWCPEHRPRNELSVPAPPREREDGELTAAAKRLAARAEEALTRLSDQSGAAPIGYIAMQARSGRRDDSDIIYLNDTLTTWIRQCCRRAPATTLDADSPRL